MFLLEASLAAWRLARMLVKEAGPNDVWALLRHRTGIEYDGTGVPISWPPWNPLHCVYCTAVYTSLAALLLPRYVRQALAVAAIAALIEAAIVEAEGESGGVGT